jgi:hypothetical protein
MLQKREQAPKCGSNEEEKKNLTEKLCNYAEYHYYCNVAK